MTWITLGPGPRLPRRSPDERRRRVGQLGIVLLAVLAAHGWLIGPLRTPLGRALVPSQAIQVVTLPPAPQPVDESPAPAEQAPPPEPTPAPTRSESARSTPSRPKEPRPVDWFAGDRTPEDVASDEAKLAIEMEEQAAKEAAAVASAPVPGTVDMADSGGGPPPIYRTTPPTQAFKLDYRMERGDASGVGQLSFEPEPDGRYRARFYGVTGTRALIDWISRGGFDLAGVAPQRLVERERGVEMRATNFQRDRGFISFSSSTKVTDLFPGAQDRVSVMLQLAAIAQAQAGGLQAGQRIRLQVANARGQVDDWWFEVVGRERIEPNGTPIDTVHLTREPTQPYDLRVEFWLAPAAGHLPAGLRFTPVPGKESTAYWLQGRLPEMPEMAASASAASAAARP